MSSNEKVITINQSNSGKIVVTHITIRQSISFLLLKLIVIEVIAIVGVILLYITAISASSINNFMVLAIPNTLAIGVFLIITLIKMFIVVFVIIQWLNEYYELTPKEVLHKSGLIYKKEERYKLAHLGSLEIEQGIFGRICNYGTLRLFNPILGQNIELYLIHNPRKYHKILRSLLPDVDTSKNILREHLIEEAD